MKRNRGKIEQLKALKKELEDIKNVDVPLSEKKNAFAKIKYSTTEVIASSLRDWQNAYTYAKDENTKDRVPLIEIYESIETDAHVSAITETIANAVNQMGYAIKTNNEPNEEKTKLFKKQWFSDFVNIALDTYYWAYSNIQLGSVKNNAFEYVKCIPRQNVIPEKNLLKIDHYNELNTVDLNKEPYNTWVISLFPQATADQYQLGRYNKVAKLYILKREVTQFWAIFNELFGIPYRVMKTDVSDKVRRQNAIDAQTQMQAAAYAVIDKEDEIEFISSTNNGAFDTFEAFINYINKEISKLLLGSTMVLEDGSSRSQAEVHQENTERFIQARALWVENVVNTELIPRMIKLGFPLTSEDVFCFEDKDDMDVNSWADVFVKLKNAGFDIDKEFVTKVTGVPVEYLQQEVKPKQSANAQNIKSFYQKLFK